MLHNFHVKMLTKGCHSYQTNSPQLSLLLFNDSKLYLFAAISKKKKTNGLTFLQNLIIDVKHTHTHTCSAQ